LTQKKSIALVAITHFIDGNTFVAGIEGLFPIVWASMAFKSFL